MRGYPVVLTDGPVIVRPPSIRDSETWRELQTRNRSWLASWEATVPPENPFAQRLTYQELVRRGKREARAGRMLPFNVWYADPDAAGRARMVGQMNVSGITWGSLCSANIGYWIDQRVAGRNITPTALALVVDHLFTAVGLHRVEINIRPENGPSRRVAEKLGFREEGLRRAYLHIDNGWRDHLSYAVTAQEVAAAGGLLARWRSDQSARTAP